MDRRSHHDSAHHYVRSARWLRRGYRSISLQQGAHSRLSSMSYRQERLPSRRGYRGHRFRRRPGMRPGTLLTPPRTRSAPPITLEKMGELADEDTSRLVGKIFDQLPDFREAIGEAVTQTFMANVVKILHKLVKVARKTGNSKENHDARVIITEVLHEKSEKFHFQLKRAIQRPECTVNEAEDFCDLFTFMLQTFQSSAKECLPISEFGSTIKILTNDGTTHLPLFEKAKELCKINSEIISESSSSSIEDEARSDYSDYKLIPIIPEWDELKIDNGTPVEVRQNKVDMPYNNWMEYFDIQFRLIREDFVAPMRRGIDAIINGNVMRKCKDIRKYTAARILSQKTTNNKGICFIVCFDVSKLKCNWKYSKRLIVGSLLCFIPTIDCDNALIGIIATHDPPANLCKGLLMVDFGRDTLSAVDHYLKETEFDIIESSSYFEATQPILRAIQTADAKSMPFTKQIINGDVTSVPPPAYLKNNTVYELSCLRGPNDRENPLQIDVLNKLSWNEAKEIELDSSQLSAIQMALTQEVAVIQGPPGTGKTYVGLKIVEALLDNRNIWDPNKSCPLLVMCYTNHALDQFLEGIIDTECCKIKPDIIRVGGRSKNEKVNKLNLKSKERTFRFINERKILKANKSKSNPCNEWDCLKRYFSNTSSLLPLHTLKQVIHPDHFYQLTQVSVCAEHQHHEVEVWLGLWHKTTVKEDEDKELDAYSLASKTQPEYNEPNSTEDLESHDDLEGHRIAEKPKDNLSQDGEYYYEEYSSDESEEDDLKWSRKNDAVQIIKNNLFNFKDCMEDYEVEEIQDILLLNLTDRWRLYNHWEHKGYKHLQEENKNKVEKYNQKCKELVELQQQEDLYSLKRADVIGMTTTGAAKYYHILHHIKPKIVIVEEAAEVLEAHIVSALNGGTQHLILIGDHKQLRPKPNEHILAEDYNLSVSLFERLVMNDISQATLEIQHRMRPEIARLVCPHVYNNLRNHESVEIYPKIRGILKNLFFVCHSQPESENPQLLSYQNEFETEYIVGLCGHLLKLGYSPSQITILTPYVGQLLLLREIQNSFSGVQVMTIDNFQGEENDIILFSMVRSTNPQSGKKSVGFIKEDNRVCVSLSRAKQGFYAVGNFELIRQQSQLWESIISDVEERNCYGDALPLYCCNHSEIEYSAKEGSDFKLYAPNGGCRSKCDIRLQCGHSCTEVCHVNDTNHKELKCIKPCGRRCHNNHPCEIKVECFECQCSPCYQSLETHLPECGHIKTVKCWMDCVMKKERNEAVNGNLNAIIPYQEIKLECEENVLKTMPNCGHEQSMPCCKDPATVICMAQCSTICKNGHSCKKLCFEYCQCIEPMEKIIPQCNHVQMVSCFLDPKQAKCKVKCETICPMGLHIIEKYCHEEWPECKEIVYKTVRTCGHSIEAKCHEDADAVLCNRPCENICENGHKCQKLCYELCAPCLSTAQKTLPCGHIHTIPCPEFFKVMVCEQKCSKIRCERGHSCEEKCHYPEPCKLCEESVTIKWPNCSHYRTLKCNVSLNPEKYGFSCNDRCEKKLSCSHPCHKECGQACQTICNQPVRVQLKCGHKTQIACHRTSRRDIMVINCKENMKVKIACGHTKRISCWMSDYKLFLTRECKKSCRRVLCCGHPCQESCSSPCTQKCKVNINKLLPCGHKTEVECCNSQSTENIKCVMACPKILACGHRCTSICGNPCSKCMKIKRVYYPCGHTSKIPCFANIADHPCKKKCTVILSCGHRCTGKCGDCYSTRFHRICPFAIRYRRFCGHSVATPCVGLSESCDKRHIVQCIHGEDSTKCKESCVWDCKHHKCGKQCGEECDRPQCNEPCDKELRCGHTCPGLCGERCLSFCPKCQLSDFSKKFYNKTMQEFQENQPFFELGCGHIFTVSYLDEYMKCTDGTIMPKQCSKCHWNLIVGSRYGNLVREALTDVNNVMQLLDDQYDNEELSDDVIDNFKLFQPCSLVVIHSPKCVDRSIMVHLLNSSAAIYLTLERYKNDDNTSNISSMCQRVIELNKRLMEEVKNVEPVPLPMFKLKRVTLHFLNDFKSELYRLSLSAQHLILTEKFDQPKECKRMKIQGETKDGVEKLEGFLQSIDAENRKISDEEYKYYYSFKEITSSSSHIKLSGVIITSKGEWRKCARGHYFCTPYIYGCAPKPCIHCPDCQ